MKKLFGVVFVTFALSLVAGSIISCSQKAPANQGNQTGNNGGKNSSTAKFVYRAQPKENRPLVDIYIFSFNQGSFVWKVWRDGGGNNYDEIVRGAYTIANGMVTVTVTWTRDSNVERESPRGSQIEFRILPNGDLELLKPDGPSSMIPSNMIINKISGILQ